MKDMNQIYYQDEKKRNKTIKNEAFDFEQLDWDITSYNHN